MYDYIIVGSGLYGAIFAHEAMKAGKSCLVVERRSHIGGNIYTKEMEGIQVHQYGAHIFHTSNKEVWDYIGQFATFNRYTNCPVAYYKGQMYNMPFNMNTFSKMWGIRTPEEAQQKIAEQIAERKQVKFVLIAGPSSSGKTTFCNRLSIQLSAHGLTPHPISLDNYYVNRVDTPRDENGDYDFECLEALDIELLNRDMTALLNGERVELPYFNFKTGKREYKGNFIQMKEIDVLVLEGIHGLNEKLTWSLPSESKFRIYISALTQINVDEHNRIPTTDGRLIRRMVRDSRTRATSAKETIAMWPSVRRGEDRNIFPNQEKADVMFNSALVYELSVLKLYAEPLLFQIEEGEPEYQEAKRLLKFLDYFVGVPIEDIPKNSILREFVGGSCFDV